MTKILIKKKEGWLAHLKVAMTTTLRGRNTPLYRKTPVHPLPLDNMLIIGKIG
jgi:hypothetical protein